MIKSKGNSFHHQGHFLAAKKKRKGENTMNPIQEENKKLINPEINHFFISILNHEQLAYVLLITLTKRKKYWVNLSERGGMDKVCQGLAGLLHGICRELCPRQIMIS